LILRKRGLSYSRLGTLKLLFLPWVCKPFYAPIVERTRSLNIHCRILEEENFFEKEKM
jgi:hypothetical protein